MKDLILGTHLLYARAGDVIDGVTVGPEAKPDTVPSSNYTVFATIEDYTPKITRSIIKRRAPSPGKYQDRRSILLNSQMEYAFSFQEWSEMSLAELLLGGNKPVAGVFVPNERTELFTAWWIWQSYDQADDQIKAMNVYGEARIDSYKFGEKLDPAALIITQLYSTLTTGEITNLT